MMMMTIMVVVSMTKERSTLKKIMNDDDNDADDEGFKPEERSASRKLCGILGDVSRHQRHHLGSALKNDSRDHKF